MLSWDIQLNEGPLSAKQCQILCSKSLGEGYIFDTKNILLRWGSTNETQCIPGINSLPLALSWMAF